TVWVVAQSNVGVKNIARSIVEHDVDFKLLVSSEFLSNVESKLICSEMFAQDGLNLKRAIGETRIILCTVAMLSSAALQLHGMFSFRPVEILVVDEASQIDSSEYMHLFGKFNGLRKVCMFGDPRQYRMPVELGKFISEAMYQSRLKSVHKTLGSSCIRAVNVRKGKEETAGSSWQNTEEAHTVVNLIRLYYKKLKGDFCIITPYDAQRGVIMKLLKAANLASDIVYNVDSFQGHEAPYAIVSAVRTTRPGFLSFDNRMNVMLSRCKRCMVLVTPRAFVEGGGKNTLLGKLVRRWETMAGAGDFWVDAMDVAAGCADMPGAPGRQPAHSST
ncbi:AAA domain-containing protein, partial [Trametes gibbosa]